MGVAEVAIISAVVGTASYIEGKEAREEAATASRNAAAEQRKAQEVQKASQAQQAAMERRQQIREERVRRARILQSAQNTGTAGSSSEFGAVGGLGTNLAANIGANIGALQRGQQISELSQKAADFTTESNIAQIEAQNSQSLFSLSTSIFAQTAIPAKPQQVVMKSE